jgi:TolB-like protein
VIRSREYFSDGISKDVITAPSKLRWFFVIARNSSFIYKGKAAHMKQVAEELEVGYVVEGSMRKSRDRVRITAQLNDVSTGSTLPKIFAPDASRPAVSMPGMRSLSHWWGG